MSYVRLLARRRTPGLRTIRMDMRTIITMTMITDRPSNPARVLTLEQRVLARNDWMAAANRRWLRDRGIVAINLMAGPGAGKTTLLERTLRDHGAAIDLLVIEGDQATEHDARADPDRGRRRRSRSTPARAVTSMRRWSPRRSMS